MASTSPVECPRNAASRAMPAPVMPPPTTSTSRSAEPSAARAASRLAGDRGDAAAPASVVAELGERGLRFGDLVALPLCRGDLEGALRQTAGLVALPATLAPLGQHQAGAHSLRIEDQHAPEHRLALAGVAADEDRPANQHDALGRQRLGVIGIELQRAIEVGHEAAQCDERAQALAVDARQLALVAEAGEVGVGAGLVDGERALREIDAGL